MRGIIQASGNRVNREYKGGNGRLEQRVPNASEVIFLLQQTVPLSSEGDSTLMRTLVQPSCRSRLGINFTEFPLYRIPAAIAIKQTMKCNVQAFLQEAFHVSFLAATMDPSAPSVPVRLWSTQSSILMVTRVTNRVPFLTFHPY
jgi:hypothetical protein